MYIYNQNWSAGKECKIGDLVYISEKGNGSAIISSDTWFTIYTSNSSIPAVPQGAAALGIVQSLGPYDGSTYSECTVSVIYLYNRYVYNSVIPVIKDYKFN